MSKLLGSLSLIGISILFLIICSGCSHSLVPNLQQVNNEKVIQFTVSDMVNVHNNQQNDQKILIGVLAMHKYYGTLRKWTDTSVELLEQELKLRGAEITPKASKTINLSVTSATLDDGGGAWRKRCIVTIQAETGNGYVKSYEGVNISGGFEGRAAGGAITLALTEMLKDDKMIKYLQE